MVAMQELWDELEVVRRRVQVSAECHPPSKLSRYDAGVKRVRGMMYSSASTGFDLARRCGYIVPEGRHSAGKSGVADVAVFAFKYDQYRCYGGYLAYGPRRAFVCVEADEAKKQTKADPAILQRVAKKLAQLTADAAEKPLKN